jgi:hypothetical protein
MSYSNLFFIIATIAALLEMYLRIKFLIQQRREIQLAEKGNKLDIDDMATYYPGPLFSVIDEDRELYRSFKTILEFEVWYDTTVVGNKQKFQAWTVEIQEENSFIVLPLVNLNKTPNEK